MSLSTDESSAPISDFGILKCFGSARWYRIANGLRSPGVSGVDGVREVTLDREEPLVRFRPSNECFIPVVRFLMNNLLV